jgi:cytoplasmic iron level regulating protein YaaA (DUF328/UPF0246 family)
MKIIYLIPPSEWKSYIWVYENEEVSFSFKKPLNIAKNASQKDLKCTWKKYNDSIYLNKNINKWKTQEAIKRYNWIMFKAIDYENMSIGWQKYFEENFLIFSWMYWILKPNDKIGNYKLPIETKWVLDFWWDKITKALNKIEADLIVDFLPDSYKKMINKKILKKKLIEVNFLDKETWEKLWHNSKSIKWEFIRKICEGWFINFSMEEFENWKINILF